MRNDTISVSYSAQNSVLGSLPPSDFEWIRPELQSVDLEPRQILCRAHVPIPAVYFLESGLVSLVARLERGGIIEIGIIGNEGIVGMPLALGAESSPEEALVQVRSHAMRMEARVFQRALARSPALLFRLLRFECAFHAQVAQTAACNGRHSVEQRLTRWLLMARDRLASDDLPLTQELLAMMLGVRRASVTNAVRILQRAGAIDIIRGHVVILNQQELERFSCECYYTVKNEYRRLTFSVRPGSCCIPAESSPHMTNEGLPQEAEPSAAQAPTVFGRAAAAVQPSDGPHNN